MSREVAAGFRLDEAYGNAGAGVPATSTWIIGPNRGTGGTHAVTGSWESRASAVSAMPAVTQPFTVPAG